MKNNYCNRCNVAVHGQHQHCPLCMKPFESTYQSLTTYPKYEVKIDFKKVLIFRAFQFVTISLITITVAVNALTWHKQSFAWSGIVTAVLIYLWVLIKGTLFSKTHIGKRVVKHYLALSFLLLVIDACTGFNKWSTTYVIPLSGIATSLVILSLNMSKNHSIRDDMGYLLSMVIINFTLIVWYFVDFMTTIWPTVAALVFSFLMITGMLIFNKRGFKEEMQKRLHW